VLLSLNTCFGHETTFLSLVLFLWAQVLVLSLEVSDNTRTPALLFFGSSPAIGVCPLLLECHGVHVQQQVWWTEAWNVLRDSLCLTTSCSPFQSDNVLEKRKPLCINFSWEANECIWIWTSGEFLSGGEGCQWGWQLGCELPCCTAWLVGFLFCVLTVLTFGSTQVLWGWMKLRLYYVIELWAIQINSQIFVIAVRYFLTGPYMLNTTPYKDLKKSLPWANPRILSHLPSKSVQALCCRQWQKYKKELYKIYLLPVTSMVGL